MNRIQFWLLMAASGLIVFLFLLQAAFAAQARTGQLRVAQAQQLITEGGQCYTRVRALATRIYQVSQQTQDQALKDLLVRQHVVTPSTPASSSAPTDTTAPATSH